MKIYAEFRVVLNKFSLLWLLPLGVPLIPCLTMAAEQVPGAAAIRVEAFASARVYPNPFYPNRGQTQVNVSGLPEGCLVKVYTFNGELVWEGKASLAGVVAWNGKNKKGRKAASGLYFLCFDQDGKKIVKKLSLLR